MEAGIGFPVQKRPGSYRYQPFWTSGKPFPAIFWFLVFFVHKKMWTATPCEAEGPAGPWGPKGPPEGDKEKVGEAQSLVTNKIQIWAK